MHKTVQNKVFVIIGGVCLSLAVALLNLISVPIAQMLSYILPSFFFVLPEKEKVLSKFLICFLATCVTRAVSLIPMVLASFVMPLWNKTPSGILLFVAVYLLTAVLVFLLLKIRRFRNGFQFFQDETHMGLGLSISGALFVLLGVIYSYGSVEKLFEIIVLIGVILSGFGLYLWIRRSITAHYRERLQLKSEEHYRQLLKEKEEELEKLSQTNVFLAKVVHRDNHLMRALGTAVNAYFESEDKQFKDELFREVQALAAERSELIEKEQRDAKILPSTGNLLIDGAVNALYIKAAARGIAFDLNVSRTVDAIIGKFISQTDLQTLICDHVKDAVIAVEATGEGKGAVFVDFSVKNENYTITFFDSGVAFAPETLAKLGKERVTAYEGSGGSGIGFMTTFETLRRSCASLIITEFENKTPFSKSVCVCFDGNTSFQIRSYRKETLERVMNREDVIWL